MHYCNWNIADYASHTAHLAPLEDLAYRRMLDFYYLHEKPLARTAKAVARDIRMVENEPEVRRVLAQFFFRSPDGYTNKRADEEIARYRAKIEAASNAGRTSAERRLNGRSTTVQRPLNGRSTTGVVQPTKNQEPGTNPPTPQEPDRASREGPAAPELGPEPRPDPPAPDRDPVVELQQFLLTTTLRSNQKPFDRGRSLMAIATAASTTGLTAALAADLWLLACGKTSDDPGGLFSELIERNTWREALDEQAMKAKERELRSRTPGGDPLAGIYGS